jgi:hypothetical protein
MSDAAEARRKRMEKIKARANNQEVLTQSLLSGNINQYKGEPEPVKTGLQTPGISHEPSQVIPGISHELDQGPPSELAHLTTSAGTQETPAKAAEEPEEDAFEKYRKIKKLEKQRLEYLRTKSLTLIVFGLLSGMWLSYTGHKDHHNFFFTFLLFDVMVSFGLSHLFKGSQVYKSIADGDGIGELNGKILMVAESAMQKARFAFEIFDDLSVFLVTFVSTIGVGQFLESW